MSPRVFASSPVFGVLPHWCWCWTSYGILILPRQWRLHRMRLDWWRFSCDVRGSCIFAVHPTYDCCWGKTGALIGWWNFSSKRRRYCRFHCIFKAVFGRSLGRHVSPYRRLIPKVYEGDHVSPLNVFFVENGIWNIDCSSKSLHCSTFADALISPKWNKSD